ncbi:hypothetical protein LJ754_14855 [Arthrobacter sp. zg-Y40]|uniref:hypothetical protein n=1 Tax=unclassified Arthrobacter TaxID=235627 RepID=UPI001D15AD6D|nr:MULTISPECIES: hypothetical protein [unclassified Arthrobacter]MCC3280428.1 hypothetical protein [Arthrobacter sp. zg-Y40]MDK1328629.1 hypothetical protein [Arthrobacter sp. zg-Y1143]
MSQETSYSNSGGFQPATPAPAKAMAPARAKTVETAFWLLLAAAATVLIRIPVAIVTANQDRYKSQMERSLGPENAEIWANNQIEGFTTAGIITALILIALALLSRMGHGWPRIVLIVVVVLTALNTRVQFSGSLVDVYEVAWVTLVSVVLTLAATVLLFLKPSSDYFKARKQHRKSKAAAQA